MKKKDLIIVVLLTLFVWAIIIGRWYIHMPRSLRNSYPSDEEFEAVREEMNSFYRDNKELLNRIKDGLFDSGFVPHDGMTETGYNSYVERSILLLFDYESNQPYCSTDSENIQYIQDIHDDVVSYFMLVGEASYPKIDFRYIRNMGIIIEFEFRTKDNPRIISGILYKTFPEGFWGAVNIEDNWFADAYMLP
ncbi:MAG: hypothetical protein FWG87_08535 [Defluviitaleaceae bacterium]|nr:hypothetical protein [Defluviitaleaceae bacterium]